MAPKERIRVLVRPQLPPEPTRKGKIVHYRHSFITGYRASLNSLTGRLVMWKETEHGRRLWSLVARDWKHLARQTKTESSDWVVERNIQ